MLALPGLGRCSGFSSCGLQGLPLAAMHGFSSGWRLVAEHGLPGAWAPVVATPGLWSAGAVAAALGLSCPVARGLCPDQEMCLLLWQADSLLLSHREALLVIFD